MPSLLLSLLPFLICSFIVSVCTPAMAQTLTGTVEIDLVFPRNDTYAPSPLFPIVFAIQNPKASPGLALGLTWSIGGLGNSDDGLLTNDFLFTPDMNFEDEPYLVVLNTNLLNNTEGTFALIWTVTAGNCSDPYSSPAGTFVNSIGTHNNVAFTLRNGAQAPDVTTPSDTCPTALFTFNITNTLPVMSPAHFNNFNTCAVLTFPAPNPTPCSVQVDLQAASSISAVITASYLAACNETRFAWHIGCPVPPKETNGVGRVFSRGLWMAPTIVSCLISLLP